MPPTADSVVRSCFEEVWNQGREDARMFRDAIPDIRIDVTRTVNLGDMVTAHGLVTGTRRGNAFGVPTGNPVRFTGICIARVQNGQPLGILPALPV